VGRVRGGRVLEKAISYNFPMQTTFTLSAPLSLATKSAKPFMKWVGGKGQLIGKLANLFPPEMKAGKIKKYVEPFIGGGALFFYIAQAYPSIEKFFISDVNEELILAYRTIKRDVESLISSLVILETKYHALSRDKQKDFFYQKRIEFNTKLTTIDFNKFQDNWIERTVAIILEPAHEAT